MRFGASVAVALVVAASVACDSTTAGENLHAQAVITLGDNYFTPLDVTVNPGDTVVWIWNGSTHNVTFDQSVTGAPTNCGQFAIGECRRTLNTVGTYPYTCTLHSGMDGGLRGVAVP